MRNLPTLIGLVSIMLFMATAFYVSRYIKGLGIPAAPVVQEAQVTRLLIATQDIPLGTRLYIEGYGSAIAGDTGSAIKGNRIDLCFDTLGEVRAFGWRTITVEILD